MSNRGVLEQRRARLDEMGDILTAMKSIALLETRKLARFIDHQRRMRANIEAAAADFLQFFPEMQAADSGRPLLIMVGSERGFCGGFNERVMEALVSIEGAQAPAGLVTVGRRLATKLGAHPRLLAAIDGATVAEDVPATLERLIDAVQAMRPQLDGGVGGLQTLAWDADAEPRLLHVLPLVPAAASMPHFEPPDLNLAPPAFFAQLLDHYLPASLQGILYGSLAAENRLRLQHMERALDRLGETVAQLDIRRNALRKEAIVEEIEVILSSARVLAPTRK